VGALLGLGEGTIIGNGDDVGDDYEVVTVRFITYHLNKVK